jgi:hypothetical protein
MSASASVVANWGTVWAEMRHTEESPWQSGAACGLHFSEGQANCNGPVTIKAGVQMTDQPDLPQGETRSERQPTSNVVVHLHEYRSSNQDPPPITFHRRELDLILRVYGRMVGDGEWRDYAMDHLRDRAVFSVFKRSGEMPLFRIEKNPRLAAKQGAYSVVNTQGTILKRGHDLQQVLKVFDKMLKLIKT